MREATPPAAVAPELVIEAARGSPAAQDAWFRAEFPRVYRLCLGFLADAAAAEDLAQDAMIHLLDRLDRWEPTRPYPGWRSTVVLNLCRDRLRRRGARQRAEAALGRLPLPARLADPQDAAAGSELRETITAALAALPPREREAFVLRDLERQETAAVAETMGITAATVRSLLTLARRRLRGILGPALAMSPEGRSGASHA